MKTFYKILSTLAFALVLFVPAKTVYSDGFPAGVSFSHIVGQVLEPQRNAGNLNTNTDTVFTTIDAVNFGFMTRYVRICLRPESADTYFRLNTSVSLTTIGGGTDLNLWELGTSANFVSGNASFDFGALPMTAPATSATAGEGIRSSCMTQPWRTRGIIAHIVSGLATIDVWGYR